MRFSMTRSALGRGLVGGVLALATIMASSALCQDFPYLVPEAPEFDARGNLQRSSPAPQSQQEVGPSVRTEPPRTAPTFANPPKTQIPRENQRYRSERREAPRTPSYYGSTREPTPAAVGPAPRQVPPQVAQPNPNQPPYQQGPVGMPDPRQAAIPQRPDCSEYPTRIAYARTEGEMQTVARYYLGCLMQTGWDQETAKRHVTSVVDSWYRTTR